MIKLVLEVVEVIRIVLFLIFILMVSSSLTFSMTSSYLLSYFFLFFLLGFVIRLFFSKTLEKAILELQALRYPKTKQKVFQVGRRLYLITFLILFCLFHLCCYLFSMTQEEKILSILFSVSFLLIPILDSYRSYFLGHSKKKYVTSSYIFSFGLIVLSIFITLLVSCFVKINTTTFSYIAVFIYLFSYIISFVPLLYSDKKYRLFDDKVKKSAVKEQKYVPIKFLKEKMKTECKTLLILPIILYLLIDFVIMHHTLIDTFRYQLNDAYAITNIMTCFLNVFVFCFLVISFTLFYRKKFTFPKKNATLNETRTYLLDSTDYLFSILLFISLLGSFLSVPLWNFVYGNSSFGPIYFSVFSFETLFIGLFLHFSFILYHLKEWKKMKLSFFLMIVFKLIFTYPFMLAFRRMVLPVVIGSMVTSMVGYLISILMMWSTIMKKYKLNIEEVLKKGMEVVSQSFLLIIVLFLLSIIIPIDSNRRILSLLVLIGYSLFAGFFYKYLAKKR